MLGTEYNLFQYLNRTSLDALYSTLYFKALFSLLESALKSGSGQHYLSVVRERLDRDIEQICQREREKILLLCERTRLEIIFLCDQRPGQKNEERSLTVLRTRRRKI